LLVALLWFGFGRDPSLVADPLVNKPAPDFSLASTSGRIIRLHSFRGRPVVLNFFASWCVACKLEEHYLVQADKNWGKKVTLLGIVYQDSSSAAAAFTRDQGGRWIDLVDSGAVTAINFGVTGVPETFFINRHGVIVYHTVSLLPAALRAGITKALAA
jgi:cytochrome c biogenesis protein CcmG/thiol:disulfide interchange protein DsbE